MRPRAHLLAVRLQRQHLTFEGAADIDKPIGGKRERAGRLLPFRARRGLERQQPCYRVVQLRATCGQGCLVRTTMIYVQITCMMRIHCIRRDLADVLLYHLDNVQQRPGVETVIGKPMHGEVLHAQYVGSCLGGGLALDDGFVSARTLAAGLTIRENDDPDLVASENVSADGASAAQYLIVRVGNNDSDAPTGLLGWGHGLHIAASINLVLRSAPSRAPFKARAQARERLMVE
jgi:hypothetical protein